MQGSRAWVSRTWSLRWIVSKLPFEQIKDLDCREVSTLDSIRSVESVEADQCSDRSLTTISAAWTDHGDGGSWIQSSDMSRTYRCGQVHLVAWCGPWCRGSIGTG